MISVFHKKNVYWVFFTFSFLNIGGLLNALTGSTFFIYPIISLITLAVVFKKNNYKLETNSFIKLTGTFFFIYFLFGFIGIDDLSISLFRHSVKLFFSIFLLPIIAYNLRNDINTNALQKWIMVLMLISSVFTIIQYFFYDFFSPICMAIANRPSGFWINPNLCGFFLFICYMLTINLNPKRTFLMRFCQYLTLIAILLTFSRTVYLISFISIGLYTIIKNDKTYWKETVVLLTAVIISFFSLYPTFNENQINRLFSFFKAVQGQEFKTNTRKYVWTSSYNHIINNNIYTGTGHTSMSRVVPYEPRGLGPHNFYLWVWGNSGIVGLISLFSFFIILFYKSIQWFKATKDSSLFFIVFGCWMFAIFEHAFPFDHTVGILISACVLIYNSRKNLKEIHLNEVFSEV